MIRRPVSQIGWSIGHYYEKLVVELGLEGAKLVATPCVKHEMEHISRDRPLSPGKFSHFRGITALANYLSLDGPDCQFSAKEVCRIMAQPTELGVQDAKRLARYFIGH